MCSHGGPGSGCGPNIRRYMDSEAYRIILFDQRGAGKSRPSAELKVATYIHECQGTVHKYTV